MLRRSTRAAHALLSASAARSRSASARADAADVAARALSDLGAATLPALGVLHHSADRLARLAESGGEMADIVAELYTVELAVTSLLGAIALAAEPDLRAPLRPWQDHRAAEPSAHTSEWTTTGVLSAAAAEPA